MTWRGKGDGRGREKEMMEGAAWKRSGGEEGGRRRRESSRAQVSERRRE
jgi:hypothetical protein